MPWTTHFKISISPSESIGASVLPQRGQLIVSAIQAILEVDVSALVGGPAASNKTGRSELRPVLRTVTSCPCSIRSIRRLEWARCSTDSIPSASSFSFPTVLHLPANWKFKPVFTHHDRRRVSHADR